MDMDIEERIGDLLDWDALTRMSVASDDWALVVEVEAEIAKRGLVEQYTTELLREINPEAGIYHSAIEVETHIGAYRDGWSLVFAIATAPPEVRVRAMLKVLEG